MSIFDKLADNLKANPKTIVLPDGPDKRVMEAAERLTRDGVLKVILIGTEDEFAKASAEGGYNLEGCEIIDPANYDGMAEMISTFVELRKGKATEEQAAEMLSHGNYFGTMLVKMGKADCLLGGATYRRLTQ